VATWAQTETILAADLLAGDQDPRRHAAQLLRRALAALPGRARAGRVALRADAGYFAGELARAAHTEGIAFAIGAKRIAPLWRLLSGIAEAGWRRRGGHDRPRSRWPTTGRTGGRRTPTC
jgi:hypothetical protein